MTESWREVSLDSVCSDITVGHVGSMSNEYVNDGIPFLRSLNVEPFRVNDRDLKNISPSFHQKLKKSSLSPGDVVIVRTGKPGACTVIPDWLPQANCSDLVIVRCGPEIRPHYAAYVINSVAQHHIDAYTVGAVQQHFNIGAARLLKFRLPPLPEQDRILALLNPISQKIQLSEELNRTLEALAKAIFKDWFIDFGPTRAKMEGIEPYLAADIWSLFPDRLDEEGLPVSWRSYFLNELAQQIRETVDPQALPTTLFKHYSLPAFDSGQNPVIENGSAILSIKASASSTDILLSKLNPEISRVWPVEDCDGYPQIASTEFLVYRPRGSVSRPLLCNLFKSGTFKSTIEGLVTGTSKSHQRVSPSSLNSLSVISGNSAIFEAYGSIARPLFDAEIKNRTENRMLTAMRDLLLPKLMSGEVQLKEAEQMTEAVM